jgi:hypothetical protein
MAVGRYVKCCHIKFHQILNNNLRYTYVKDLFMLLGKLNLWLKIVISQQRLMKFTDGQT